MHSSVPSEPPELTVVRIGRFYLTRELGRGTIGCVYLGHDPVIGRDVAIKTFNPRLTPAERHKWQHQFINEARAAGRLSHPHIVTIHDASSEGGTVYIAMEHLQGRTLHRLLDSGHRFRPDEAAAIIWKLADALHHAHRNEVIHRDVKPANIFMVNGDHPKLIDFGIARTPHRSGEPEEHHSVSHTLFLPNNLLGTPNYMSPEQAQGKDVDARTDIYSLGAVMYEMLTGRMPFHANSAEKLLQQIAYKAPPAPHEVDSDIPMALSLIVMRAMSKRPEKRYQDAEEMAHDLKLYLQKQRRAQHRLHSGLPPQEKRPTRLPLLRRLLSRLARFAAGTVAATAVIHFIIHFVAK